MDRSALRQSRLLPLLLVAALVTALGACGQDNSSTTPGGAKPTRPAGENAQADPTRAPAVIPTPTDAPFSFGWFTQQDLAGDWLILTSNAELVSLECAAQDEPDEADPAELAQMAQYVSLLSVYSSIGGSFESSGRGQYRFTLDPNGDFAGELADAEMPTQFSAEMGYDGRAIVATQNLQIVPVGGPTGTGGLLLAASALPLGLAAFALRRRRAVALSLVSLLLLTQLTGCVGFYGGISSSTTFNRIADGRASGGFKPLLELQDGYGTLVFDLTLVTEQQPEGAAADAPAETVEESCRIEVGYDATAALFADGTVTEESLPQLIQAGYLPAGLDQMFGGSDE